MGRVWSAGCQVNLIPLKGLRNRWERGGDAVAPSLFLGEMEARRVSLLVNNPGDEGRRIESLT